ncbi:MAG: LamG-like jellyroll fold domain-containing protein, partial [Thermoleophilaceae bacterium]
MLALLAPAGEADAGTLPTGFQESVVFDGLTNPMVIRFAPDGRVFVGEKSGLIKVFGSLSDTSPTIFADLRTNVYNFWDRGLLGLALDPQFPADPYVYVLYAFDADIGGAAPKWGAPGATSDPCPSPPGPTADGCVISARLSRLEAGGDVWTGAESVLVEDWCQQYPSHSVGQLQFGPDGALYASGGDGASFNFVDYGQDGNPTNPCGDPPGGVGATLSPPTAEGGALRSQDVRTSGDPVSLDGSIIRIDPDTGAALPDNPNAFASDPNERRIIAHGFRNPFRFTVRPGTDELWIGDVGWNDWEEVNRLADPLGTVENFGWPCYEGNLEQDGYDGANVDICENLYAEGAGAVRTPFFTYNHTARVVSGESCPTGSSSLAGIAFYEGGNYPGYNGALFFADYSRDCIWAMFEGASGVPDPATRITFDAGAANPVDIEIGPAGDLFYVDFDGGTIRRIQFFSGNQPPTAVASANPTSGTAPLTVDFDGTASSDPDAGDTLSFEWDLDGDGAYDDSTAAQPTFTYTTPAAYTVRMRVTDGDGASAVDTLVINANGTPPTATIATPSAGTTWRVGDVIAFSGSATDADEGTLPASALSWSLVIHHCPSNCHTHPIQEFAGVAGGSFTAPDHEYPSHLELRLTATDSSGLENTASVLLFPDTVDLTFESVPSGLELTVGGTSTATPFTRTVIPGSANSIIATTPQVLDGETYEFASWSDGGAQTHTVVAPAAPATYTATYEASDATPVPGLVAAYSFDIGAGTLVRDASGHGNDGTISGALWSSAGKYGSALSFNGVNSWVTVPDAPSLDLTSGMTLEAWVRPAVLGTGWRTVLFKEQPGNLVYGLYANRSSRVPVAQVDVGGVQDVNGTTQLQLDAWSHLAATYDGATLRLYVNGVEAGIVGRPGGILTSAGVLHIGGNSVWPEWFNGLIDEVRVYDRPLSQAEIQADMNTSVGVPDSEAPGVPGNVRVTGSSAASLSLGW